MASRKRTIAIALGAVALAVVIALAWYVQSPAMERRLVAEANRLLQRQGLALEIERLHFNLRRMSVSLGGVKLRAAHKPDLPDLFTAARIDATIDLWQAIRGFYVITGATIDSPRLQVIYFPDGTSNLPLPRESKPGPVNYRIQNLRATKGAVRVEDRGSGLLAQIPAFEAALDYGVLASQYEAKLTVPALQLRYADRDWRASTLQAVLHTNAAFENPRIELLGADTSLGRIEVSGVPTALQFKAVSSLAQLAALTGKPSPVSSDIVLTGKLDFPEFDRKRLTAEARLLLRGAGGGIPLSGDATLHLANEKLRAGIHSLQIPGVRTRGDIEITAQENLSGRLSLEVFDAAQAVAPYRKQLPPIAGRIAAQVALRGKLREPQASIQLDRAALDIGEFKALTATGQLEANSRELTIARLQIGAAGEQATLEGKIRPQSLDLRAGLDQASIRGLLSLVPNNTAIPIDGRLTAQAQITGNPRDPQATASLEATSLVAWEEQLGTLQATANFTAGRLAVPGFKFTRDAGHIRGEGAYAVSSGLIALQAQFSQFAVSRYAKAILDGKVNLHGTMENPEGDFQFSAPGIVYEAKTIGPFTTTGTLRNQTVAASLQVPSLGVEGNVKAPIKGPQRFEFDARFRNSSITTLAALAGQAPQDVEGRFDGDVAGVYTGDLATAEATASITRLDATYRAQPIRTTGPLQFSLAKGMATIQPARLQIASSFAEFSGLLPIEPGAAIPGLNLKARLQLTDLPTLLPQQIRAASGELQLDATIRGSLRKPQIESAVRLEKASIQPLATPLAFEAVELQGNISGEKLQIARLAATYSSGKISGEGVIPLHLFVPHEYLSLPERAPARLQLRADQLPVEAIPGRPEKLQGSFSLALDATAPTADPASVEATLQIPDAKLRLGEFDVALVKPALATLRKNLLQLDQLELKGPETQLRTRGYIRAAAPYAANLSTDGNLDIALISAFLPDWTLSGESAFQFAIRGSLSQPTMAGFLELKDGLASKEQPSLDASAIHARVSFEGSKITLESLKGELNGGTFEAQGGANALFSSNQSFEARNVDLRLKAANMYLEPVAGLKTLTDATLRVEGSSAGLSVSGDITAQESSYDEPIQFEQALLNSLRTTTTVTTLEESAAGIPVALNVLVRTLAPLQINNNLLRAAVDADLRLRGTVNKPGLTGRLSIDEGSQLFLNERTYTVERGTVVFTDERRIAPTLDIAARTRVNEYDITLRLQGPPGRELQTTLSADPPLPEQDVLAVLATGRRMSELEGSESAVLREQVLSYLAGSVGGGITSRAGRAIGLSQVRIEPSLIASETEPTARLTLGQDFTRQLGLVYSMNLRDSSDQIWIGKYDVTRRFTTRAIRQSDETYRFQFQHDLQFGGRQPETQAQKKRTAQRVSKVTIIGDSPFPAKEVEGWLGIHDGSRYDFFQLRKGMDKIRQKHADKGYLEVRVTNTRQENANQVELNVEVKAGPRIRFAYEGWDPSRSERQALRDTWRGAAFEALRLRAVERKASQQLSADGYLQATVEVKPRANSSGKLILIEAVRGKRYSRQRPRFLGLPPERERALHKLIEPVAYSDPSRAAALIRDRFQREGFLDVQVKTPPFTYDESSSTALATYDILLGPQYRIGDIAFAGADKLPANTLRARLPFLAGAVYTPELDNRAIDSLFLAYGDSGYSDAQIEQRLRRDPFTGLVHLAYTIQEGPQRVVSDVQIAGNQYTSDNLIRTQLAIRPGEVLHDGKVAQARRNLYSTGAFTIADVEMEPLARQPDPEKKLVTLNTKVQEVRPFEIRYGGFYDTERGAGGIVDITNRNMLGGARTVGLRTRYDSTLREARAYYDQPTLLRFPVKTTATLFARRESNPGFYTDRVGGSINGEYRFKGYYRLDFGYRLENTHTFEKAPDPFFPFDVRLRIAPLTAAISRDTRDEILDATRGSFSSHAFEIAPETLGSQLRYVKYYGQYFHYRSFGGTREVPWARAIRPRFTYAGGVRLGLATGLGGQTVIQSERFFAGGANTVRGFDRNFLGPLDFDGTPLGGNAVAILNQEIRFPLYKMIDGAGFFDAGNLSTRVSNFSNSEWRKSAGFGLRLRTPYVLLRVDYGVKLGRRPGESTGQFFFSIGQAF
ncbi:MAG: translocation/assembly module TamB domain-containing protein [Acidobacteria bacterium]|nr:translocation/assembly module TamB domain-containing protein [Acidobacteriota bacterium]